MFDQISGAHQAMLWLAVIMACGFTMFTVFTIVPLIRFLQYLVQEIVELKKFGVNKFPNNKEANKDGQTN